MGRLFGTDGVRGLANADLTAELALDLAVAAAHVLGDVGAFGGHEGRPVAVVGRDTRASGEFLEAAVVAGLASAGVDVWRVGALPTPAVAYLTAELDADLGVVLSASHNPMPDNGIKLLARGGHKLADDVEDAIEKRMNEEWTPPDRRCRRPGERPRRGRGALPRAPALDHPAPARRPHRRRRRRQRRGVLRRTRGAASRGRHGGRDPHRARRPQHQRQLRLDAPRRPRRRRGRARRRRRRRVRRRRRPLPGRRRAGRGRRRRPRARDPRPRDARARCARARHRRRDGDGQPRLPDRRAGGGRSRSSRPGSATATCSRRCARAASSSAASRAAT